MSEYFVEVIPTILFLNLKNADYNCADLSFIYRLHYNRDLKFIILYYKKINRRIWQIFPTSKNPIHKTWQNWHFLPNLTTFIKFWKSILTTKLAKFLHFLPYFEHLNAKHSPKFRYIFLTNLSIKAKWYLILTKIVFWSRFQNLKKKC